LVLTLNLSVLYDLTTKQRLLPYTTLADWCCEIEIESLYWAVRTDILI